CTGAIAVVHNGTIENFAALRAGLEERGHELRSDTDTEAVCHLIEERYTGDLAAAVRSVARDLAGSFVLVVAHRDQPDLVVGARRNLPLVVGLGEGENFLASDVEFFMLKEIDEQPQAVADTLGGRLTTNGLLALDELSMSEEDIRGIDNVFVVACGSAYHSGLIGKYAIERWARLPVQIEMASEFRYRDPVLDRNTLVIAISQSGETADTIEAVRHARAQRAWVLAVSNTVNSTIPRESDAALYTRAGPEVAVAATKTVITQITAMYLVGLYLAQVRGTRDPDEVRAHLRDLRQIPALIAETLRRMDSVRELAQELTSARTVLFIGRHVGYPMAMEGALKLKELAYMHAEGFPAGELKHGPIALIEEGTPVVIVGPRSPLLPKLVNNVQEIRTRGARTIVIATDGDETVAPYGDVVIRVPDTKSLFSPLLTLVPLQILSSEVARLRGLDVDQPRNLAKSVTVE
ncbi:MAG: glutamine--fructose-6-phosphate transaminase (isomerizing), partial [Frankia sp.]|nr:glutamine--fructose-6-phosphate transaminase (isomerizing) [Frankia sp.]